MALTPVRRLPLANAMRLPLVDLIQEPSCGDVLSDVEAGTADPTGDLGWLLVEAGLLDRVETGAFSFLLQSTSETRAEPTPEITAAAALLTAEPRFAPRGGSARL